MCATMMDYTVQDYFNCAHGLMQKTCGLFTRIMEVENAIINYIPVHIHNAQAPDNQWLR